MRVARGVCRRGATVAAALLVSLLGVQCGEPKKLSEPKRREPAPLGVLFNGWFGFGPQTGECRRGLGSTHWNDGPDTAGIVHTPLPAPGESEPFYCSADPVRIQHQIELMEDAGISVLLYSWWGWGDSRLDGRIGPHPDKWMNHALTGMLEQLKQRKSRLKVAILIEPFTQTHAQVPPARLERHQFQSVLEFLYANYYRPYANQMFLYEGKPLLATFDPMFMPVSEILNPTRTGTPERDDVIEWWPRSVHVELEIKAPSASNRAAEISVDEHVVRVVLGSTAKGQLSTRAADLVEIVRTNALASRLLGASLPSATEGRGLLSPVPRTVLSPGESAGQDIAQRWTVRWLSSKDRSKEFEKEGWHWWLVPQQPLSTTLSSDGVVFLNHRFSEYYLHMAQASYLTWRWRDIDPMLDKGIYEQQWQWALDNRERLELVFLYSWNFYGELAQLEPSTLGPAPPGREYLERTKQYYRQFRAGTTKLQQPSKASALPH